MNSKINLFLKTIKMNNHKHNGNTVFFLSNEQNKWMRLAKKKEKTPVWYIIKLILIHLFFFIFNFIHYSPSPSISSAATDKDLSSNCGDPMWNIGWRGALSSWLSVHHQDLVNWFLNRQKWTSFDFFILVSYWFTIQFQNVKSAYFLHIFLSNLFRKNSIHP